MSQAKGKAKRASVPRSSHGKWKPSSKRPDLVELLKESSRHRLPELVPIRYGRMLVSPFSFLRGAAIVMAEDLAHTPRTGFTVQLGGDAHLRNFGVYASPERLLLFDLNDFDETLPGPWEWDVKRLAASFVVAGRCNRYKESECLDAARACARSYRERIQAYSAMPFLDLWYSKVNAEEAMAFVETTARKRTPLQMEKALGKNDIQALSKLTEVVKGRLRLRESPPVLLRVKEPRRIEELHSLFRNYLTTLQEDRRTLLERYRILDFALKVVGVGSVGTRCYVVLLASHAESDPLLLQLKEADESVLARHLPPSKHAEQGRRVVCGQRLMQAASDIFLGWASDGKHHYYFRQLRDMKGGADIESMSPGDFSTYARLCGWVLARAHARSGDASLIGGYLGKREIFDDAIARFAKEYADQTEADLKIFTAAVRAGTLPAERGV